MSVAVRLHPGVSHFHMVVPKFEVFSNCIIEIGWFIFLFSFLICDSAFSGDSYEISFMENLLHAVVTFISGISGLICDM